MATKAMSGDAIRTAFRQLSGFALSTDQFLAMMKAAGVSFQAGMGRSRFAEHRAYYEGPQPLDRHKISSYNEERLRRFFYDTPLGRGLLNPISETVVSQARERLIATLFAEVIGGQEFAGLYFVLHSSYRYKRHRAIHLMEITYTEERRLVVVDTIHDNKSEPPATRESSGTVTIFNEKPQIVTYGKENRVGFSLFVAGIVMRTPLNQEGLYWIYGMLTGITDMGLPFSRKALMIKRIHAPTTPEENERFEGARESMFASTGIFSPSEIIRRAQESEHGAVISSGFGKLARFPLEGAFDDPLQRKSRA